MDYGQFKTYEKVTNASGFPRTRQEQGLFLLELGFSPELETRSVNVPMTVEFSGFGDVICLRIKRYSAYASREGIPMLQSQLEPSDSSIRMSYNPNSDDLSIQFLQNSAERTRDVPGVFVLDSHSRLVTIVARLRN